MKKVTIWFLVLVCTFLAAGSLMFVQAADTTPTPSDTQTPTPTTTPSLTPSPTQDNSEEKQALQNQINDLQNKISDLQNQEKTLSSQIEVMDSQIKLTKLRIESTKGQIAALISDIATTTKKIDGLNGYLNSLTKVLIDRIVATYEVANIQPIQVLLVANSASDFLSRLSYLQIAQAHDKKLIYDTQQAKDDYANQQQIFQDKKKQVEALKAQLEAYTNQLAQQQQSKKDLLAQTQGSEANYQRILAETKAQLAAFSNFVNANGGASLLSNQTVCDSWGCYYNQRDSQWGGNSLNGTQYTLADSGCLITSVAMVATHYGHKDVTPQSINSSSGNFDGIPAALLKYSIGVNGISITRNKIGSSYNALPTTISDPVIVGISYDGGPWPDHFVVLISGANGNYMMNDPFIDGGHSIPFTSHYSLGSIVEVDTVSM